jgi:hypothetical protein
MVSQPSTSMRSLGPIIALSPAVPSIASLPI